MQRMIFRIFGVVGLFWFAMTTTGRAELPMSSKERQKQIRTQLQIKCLQNCEIKGYQSLYRCGPDGSRYNKASTDVYFRACVQRCNVAWFCGVYRQSMRNRCPAVCLQQHQSKRPKKTWKRYPTRKQYIQWLRRYQQWERRTRYACRRLCANYNMICNIYETVILPPKTPLPKLGSVP